VDDVEAKVTMKATAVLPHVITQKASSSYSRFQRLKRFSSEDMGLSPEQYATAIAAENAVSLEATLQFISVLNSFKRPDAVQGDTWIPVVDVSGSMHGDPMEASIALGLLLCLTNDPQSRWFCHIVSFDSVPKICNILRDSDFKDNHEEDSQEEDNQEEGNSEEGPLSGWDEQNGLAGAWGLNGMSIRDPAGPTTKKIDSLHDVLEMMLADRFMLGRIVNRIRRMSWGGSTDLMAVFEQQLKPLEMQMGPKRDILKARIGHEKLIVFTDMEWDDGMEDNASMDEDGPGLTVYEQIKKAYSAHNINPPNIVFWNLRSSESIPVKDSGEKGVVMVSGVSAALLQAFLQHKLEEFTPIAFLEASIDKDPYTKLKLV
jgi:hypothetical protein